MSSNAALARRVLERGARVITQFGVDEATLAAPAVQSLYDTVARAAETVWEQEQDEQALEQALILDRRIASAERAAPAALRRLGRLAEAAGAPAEALDAWRRLLAGLPEGASDWYEARYQSVRLLWELEPEKARSVMAQHRLLHPDFGPEPWGAKLRELNGVMAETAPSPEAQSGPGAGP
jgi:tetratricopeptide (TPR) repeat protein